MVLPGCNGMRIRPQALLLEAWCMKIEKLRYYSEKTVFQNKTVFLFL